MGIRSNLVFNRQLQSFLVVARCGNLNHASELLYITPSALSQQMGLLEQALGFRLFDRSNKGMRLTPAGETLFTDLLPIFEQLENAVSRAETAARMENAELRIGYHLEDDISCLETVCLQFRERCPETQLRFDGLSYHLLSESVRDGTIDLAIMYCRKRTEQMGFFFNPIINLNSYIWVPPHHILAKRKAITFEDLRGENVLFPKVEDADGADTLREYLEENEPEVHIGQVLYNGSLMLSSCMKNNLVLCPIPFGKKLFPMVPVLLETQHPSEAGFVYKDEPKWPEQVFMTLTREILIRQPDLFDELRPPPALTPSAHFP